MNKTTTNILHYNLEQVLMQHGGMAAVEKDYDNTEMDDTEPYCMSTDENGKEMYINIIFIIFGGFQVKIFCVNTIKQK